MVTSRLRRPSHLKIESLEDRCVLSATLLPDQLILTTTAGAVRTVNLARGTDTVAAIAAYSKDSTIATVEQAQVVSIAAVPNDTSFSSLYAMENTGQSGGTIGADISATEAWDITTGSYGITVGVIDTGIDYTHPDLYRNIWINQGEIPTGLGVIDTDDDDIITFVDLNHSDNSGKATDLNGNGYIDAGDLLSDTAWEDGSDTDGNGYADDLIGWDFINNDNDPYDDNGHGTHVAGTIGAEGNNATGVVGVNWTVSMAGLKFLSAAGSGSTAGAINAVNYAVTEGIMITNNSWGGGGYSSGLAAAISSARDNGSIFVAAAGNSAVNNDVSAHYPSSYDYDNVVSVASTDRKDTLSYFSNYGATSVDLAAPGSSIYSTLPGGYGTYSGTSMATPHVAGAMALVWSLDPSQTYDQVISRVLDNVDAISGLSGKVATGGRLNVYNAVLAVPVDATGPRVTSSVANSVTAPSSIRLTFSEAIDAGSFTVDDITNFTGPNGAITVDSVTEVDGSGGTQFDVTFAAQTTKGTYGFDVGPDIFDTAGNAFDQNQDGVTGETHRVTFTATPETTTTYSSSTKVTIRDRATVSSTIKINDSTTINDLNVKVTLTHTYVSDLYLYLKGPTGKIVDLVKYRGGSGDNFTGTTFDDEASTAISSGAAPFSGSYRPEGKLSDFDNTNAKGTWTLYIKDNARYDVGTLTSWSLTVTGTESTGSKSLDVGSVARTTPVQASGVGQPSISAAGFTLPSVNLTQAPPVGTEARLAWHEARFNAEVAIIRREAADEVFATLGQSTRRSRAADGDEFGLEAE